MASQCQVTGKGKMFGHNKISKSERKTNRAFNPNLQKITTVVDGKKVRLTVAASTIRTLKKKGLISSRKPAASAK
ncbi:50S ribosomal protein L28 [Candidatus Saccharibacteria bacterium]|nr:50S ribosomal protein L28 [Candidatus Saccharibacteria bacterium]